MGSFHVGLLYTFIVSVFERSEETDSFYFRVLRAKPKRLKGTLIGDFNEFAFERPITAIESKCVSDMGSLKDWPADLE
jgi:hypothetical protein